MELSLVERLPPPAPPGQPLVFGGAAQLTGFFHAPQGEPKALAVVLCPPLAFEEASVHRTLGKLAERLAGAGLATLRFDYPGTGNSPFAEPPGGLAPLLESVRLAAAEAARLSGGAAVALLGIRLGATLAALVAEAPATEVGGPASQWHLDRLVLWAPVDSGQSHVRELRAFARLKNAVGRTPPPGLTAPRSPAPVEEIAGYRLPRPLLEDLAAVQLRQLLRCAARRVAVVVRREPAASRRSDAAVLAHFQTLSARVSRLDDAGFAQLLRDDPYQARAPEETLPQLVTWLSADLGSGDRPTPASPPPLRQTTLPAPSAQAPLRETLVRFGPGAGLFGVVTEPAAGADQLPALCLVNVGANHLAAPHRLNVTLARLAAQSGHLALRLDVAGLGDSATPLGRGENRLYTKEAVGDLRAALDFLSQSYGARQFLVGGLCSGAFVAFHTAVADRRVVGQLLVSPYAFEWTEGDAVEPTARAAFPAVHSTRFYVRTALQPRTWGRLLRGDVDLSTIAGALTRRAYHRAAGAFYDAGARLGVAAPVSSEVERQFRALDDRGVYSWVVAGFEDGGLDTLARYLGPDARRMRGRPRFRLEVVPGADHTFAQADSQRRLLHTTAKFLRRASRVDGPAPGR